VNRTGPLICNSNALSLPLPLIFRLSTSHTAFRFFLFVDSSLARNFYCNGLIVHLLEIFGSATRSLYLLSLVSRHFKNIQLFPSLLGFPAFLHLLYIFNSDALTLFRFTLSPTFQSPSQSSAVAYFRSIALGCNRQTLFTLIPTFGLACDLLSRYTLYFAR